MRKLWLRDQVKHLAQVTQQVWVVRGTWAPELLLQNPTVNYYSSKLAENYESLITWRNDNIEKTVRFCKSTGILIKNVTLKIRLILYKQGEERRSYWKSETCIWVQMREKEKEGSRRMLAEYCCLEYGLNQAAAAFTFLMYCNIILQVIQQLYKLSKEALWAESFFSWGINSWVCCYFYCRILSTKLPNKTA